MSYLHATLDRSLSLALLIALSAIIAIAAPLAADSAEWNGMGDTDWVTGGANGDDDWEAASTPASYPGVAANETASFNQTSVIAVSAANLPANALDRFEVNGGNDVTINMEDGVTLDLGTVDFNSSGGSLSLVNSTGSGEALVLMSMGGVSTGSPADLNIGDGVRVRIVGGPSLEGLTLSNDGIIAFSDTITQSINIGTLAMGEVIVNGGSTAVMLTGDASFTKLTIAADSTLTIVGAMQASSDVLVESDGTDGGVLTVAGQIDILSTATLTLQGDTNAAAQASTSSDVMADGGVVMGDSTNFSITGNSTFADLTISQNAVLSPGGNLDLGVVSNDGLISFIGTFAQTFTGTDQNVGDIKASNVMGVTIVGWDSSNSGQITIDSLVRLNVSDNADFTNTTIVNNGELAFPNGSSLQFIPGNQDLGDVVLQGPSTNVELHGEWSAANTGTLTLESSTTLELHADADFSNLTALSYQAGASIEFQGGGTVLLNVGASSANIELPDLTVTTGTTGKIYGESPVIMGALVVNLAAVALLEPTGGNFSLNNPANITNNGTIHLKPLTNNAMDTTITIGSTLLNGDVVLEKEASRMLTINGSATLDDLTFLGDGDFIWTGVLALNGSLLDSRDSGAITISNNLSLLGAGVRAISSTSVRVANQILIGPGANVEMHGNFAAQRGGDNVNPDVRVSGELVLAGGSEIAVGNAANAGTFAVGSAGFLRTCSPASPPLIRSGTPAVAARNFAMEIDGTIEINGLMLENVGAPGDSSAILMSATAVVNQFDNVTITGAAAASAVIEVNSSFGGPGSFSRLSISGSSTANILMNGSTFGNVNITPGASAGGTLYGDAFEDDSFNYLIWEANADFELLATDPAAHSANSLPGDAINLSFATTLPAPTNSDVRVRGNQRGYVPNSSIDGAGTTELSVNLAQPFFAGEMVEVYLAGTIQDDSSAPLGTAVIKRFRVATEGEDPIFNLQSSNLGAASNDDQHAISADFDGDGDLDLVLAPATGTPSLYLNDGNANFTLSAGVFSGMSADIVALATGDLNSDGFIDLVVGIADEQNRVYINSPGSPGTFTRVADAGQMTTSSLFLADLSGDGRLDIVEAATLNLSAFSISELTGVAPVAFGSPAMRGMFGSDQIALGDVDHDGDIDVVSTSSSTLRLHKNIGSGTFSESVLANYSGTASAVALEDMDGDGDLDAIVAATFVNVVYNLGCGDFASTLSRPASINALGTLSDFTFGDFNADGVVDLLVSSASTVSGVAINNGIGGVSEFLLAGPGNLTAQGVAVGDFNNDNRLDLAFARTANAQSVVWLNAGLSVQSISPTQNAQDATSTEVISATFPAAIATADATTLAVNGTFSGDRSQSPWNGSYSGDGTTSMGFDPAAREWIAGEVITASITDALQSVNGIPLDQPIVWQFRVAASQGTGSFLTPIPAGSNNANTLALAAGDFTGDGLVDIAIGLHGEQNYIMPNDGNGGFGASIPFGLPSSFTTSLAAGDFNRDGLLDLAVGNDGAGAGEQDYVYINQGGTFGTDPQDAGVIALGSASTITLGVAAGDLNGDGWVDLLSARLGAQNGNHLNNGSGTSFTDLPFGSNTGESFSIAIADVDNDGDLDAIVGNAGTGQQGQVWLNAGTGRLDVSVSFGPMDANPVWLEAADFNGDGHIDIAAADSSTQASSFVYINDGEGQFPVSDQDAGAIAVGNAASQTYGLAVGDFDADGDLDIMTANDFGGQNTLWLNDGMSTPSFSAGGNVGGADDTPVATAADFNGDGTIDIFVGAFGQQDVLFLGISNLDPLAIVTGSVLDEATAGEFYSNEIEAIGGLEPYMWGIANQPAWLSINANTGQLFGTPPAGTSSTELFQITVTDDLGSQQILNAVLQISLPGVLRIQGTLPVAYEGMSYSANPPVRGGLRPYTISLLAGPTWLSIDSLGVLNASVPSGSEGSYSVRISVTDAENSSIEGTLALRVRRPILINTYAGTGNSGNSGDGASATSAELAEPYGLAWRDGSLYISDRGNNRVRVVNSTTGNINAFAATGIAGYEGDDGPAINAEMALPQGIRFDSSGNLLIADSDNGVIRMVAPDGTITTILSNNGTATPLSRVAIDGVTLLNPTSIATLDSTVYFVADSDGHRVWRVDRIAQDAVVIAGTGAQASSGDGGQGTAAELNQPAGLALKGRTTLYIAEAGGHRVRALNLTTGVIRTVAGIGTAGSTGDGGQAAAASLNAPVALLVDGAENLFIAEALGARIRRISTATGLISTVAGTGSAGYSGDGGLATSAQLTRPVALAINSTGSLFIADAGANVVRVIPTLATPRTAQQTSGAELQVEAHADAPSITTVTPGVRELTLGAWKIAAVDRAGAVNSLRVTLSGAPLNSTTFTQLRLFNDANRNGMREAGEALIAPLMADPVLPATLTFNLNATQTIGAGDALWLVLTGTLNQAPTTGTMNVSIQSSLDVGSVGPSTALTALPVGGEFPLAGISQFFSSTLPALPQLGELSLSTTDAEQGQTNLEASVTLTNAGAQAMRVDSFALTLTHATSGATRTLQIASQSPSTASLAPRASQGFLLRFDLPAGLPQGEYLVNLRVTGSDVVDQIEVSDRDVPQAQALNVFAPLTITTTSLPRGLLGQSYTALISSFGGKGAVAIRLANGVLPLGLNITSAGVISGQTNQNGSYPLLVTATDQRGISVEAAYTLVVSGNVQPSGANDDPGFFITTTALPNGEINQLYEFALSAIPRGGEFSIENGQLPAGITLVGAVLSGTPTAGGASSFTLRYAHEDQVAEASFTLTITDPSLIAPGGQPAGSATGINVDPASNGVTSATGDSANLADVDADPRLNFVDLGSDDAAGPNLVWARWIDANEDEVVSSGDQLIVRFDEAVSGGQLADFTLGGSGGAFGTGARMGAGDGANSRTILLGDGAALVSGGTSISISNNSSFEDFSGNLAAAGTVTIGGGETVMPSIRLITPAEGEALEEGLLYTIEWLSEALPASAEIELYLQQDGSDLLTIASALEDSGRFRWELPQGLEGSGYSIRLSADDPSFAMPLESNSGSFSVNGYGSEQVGTGEPGTGDDALPATAYVRFASRLSVSADESAATRTIYLTLVAPNGALEEALSFRVLDLATGTADPLNDYGYSSSYLTFPTGSVTGDQLSVSISVTADTIVEGNETVILGISDLSPGLVAVNPAQHSFTIRDDDGVATLVVSAGDNNEAVEADSLAQGARIFDAIVLGHEEACPLEISIYNAGSSAGSALVLGSPQITGDGAANFAIELGDFTSALGANLSTEFTIRLNPQAVGLQRAWVSFTHNAQGIPSPFRFEISANIQPLFAERVAMASVISSNAFALGDIDQDGDADLVAVDSENSRVALFVAEADGSYAPPLSMSTLDSPQAVAIGDLTGDGVNDVIIAERGDDRISIHPGRAGDTPDTSVVLSVGAAPVALALDDFNLDGLLDIAVALAEDEQIGIFLNDGMGGFASPLLVSLPFGLQPVGLRIADLNRDGKTDLIVWDNGLRSVRTYMGAGDGSFGLGPVTMLTGDIVDLAIAEFNRDARLDLITLQARDGGQVLQVRSGNAGGSFLNPQEFVPDASASRIVTGDFNNDARSDFALTVAEGTPGVSVWLQSSEGSFALDRHYAGDSGVMAIAAADLDRDGKLDLLASSASAEGFARWQNNLGQPCDQFFEADSDNAVSVADPNDLELADLNRDGILDLIVLDHAGDQILLARGETGGAFAASEVIATLNHPGRVRAADLDHDGDLDLFVICASSMETYRNDGTGNFTAWQSFGASACATDLVIGDIDGDGWADLVTSSTGSPELILYLNDGAGELLAGAPQLIADSIDCLDIADFDSNGEKELLVGSHSAGVVAALEWDGMTFQVISNTPSIYDPSAVKVADFNRDGHTDFAALDGDGEVHIFLWEIGYIFSGTSTGSPYLNNAVTGVYRAESMTLCDADNDGAVDIVLAMASSTTIKTFYGDGEGDIRETRMTSMGVETNALRAGDLNRDGRIDLIGTNTDNGEALPMLNRFVNE